MALGADRAPGARARSCVVLWLNGGPSHLDTFDPKPNTKDGGPFKAIRTRTKGVEFSEHLPQLAALTHRMAVVRGSSKEGNHQRARYLLHTGYAPNPTVVHPALGGWVSALAADKNSDLPAFVSIGGPSESGGFLGVQHGPFVVPRASAPQNVAYARNVDAGRFDRRLAALGQLDAQFLGETDDPQVQGRREIHAQAVRLMRSPHLRAFDVSDEPARVQKAYGDTDFGRGCLAARRLLDQGVRLVEVVLDGWDTHKDGFERIKKLSSALDPAMAALVHDLEDRHRLDSTLVICVGEFGRTPRINGDEGRDHHPQAWTALLAGGGVRGGVVRGQTDAAGAKTDRP
ncbi:MAG: DUF1501 domain-containing protein, partial [Myxococcales bacterium]